MFNKGITIFRTAATLALATLISGCLTGDPVESPAAVPPPPGGGNPTNNPPTIGGTPPAAVMIGNTYSFTPTASDPDGDSLSFSVQNLPLWASFDTTDGSVTGTPNLGDAGVYPDIEIAVNDGAMNATLPMFAVTVTQTATGSVTLSWTPPTTNTDGSTLTDLAAYKIYYGFSSGNYPNEIRIDNPGISSYVVDNLAPGTYFFVSTAINTGGIESTLSNEATTTVMSN